MEEYVDFAIRVNGNGTKQEVIQARMIFLALVWQHFMPPAVRKAWGDEGETVKIKSRFMRSGSYSAYPYFVKNAMPKLESGEVITHLPPKLYSEMKLISEESMEVSGIFQNNAKKDTTEEDL